jgi:hypothetical protein
MASPTPLQDLTVHFLKWFAKRCPMKSFLFRFVDLHLNPLNRHLQPVYLLSNVPFLTCPSCVDGLQLLDPCRKTDL